MGADAVFISYSHDSPEHSDNVLALANALIQMGLQVELDQFVTRPPQGWPHWCVERLRPESAKFVLMICTLEYCDRIENRVEFDKGRGAYWEGALIHQYIYEGKGNTRFIPILLGDASDDCVPFPLRPYPRYRLKAFDFSDTEFKKLYRELTNQPAIIRPAPGRPVELPPRTILKNETATATVTPKAGAVVRLPADIAGNELKIISLLWVGITLMILGGLYYILDILYLSNFFSRFIESLYAYIGLRFSEVIQRWAERDFTRRERFFSPVPFYSRNTVFIRYITSGSTERILSNVIYFMFICCVCCYRILLIVPSMLAELHREPYNCCFPNGTRFWSYDGYDTSMVCYWAVRVDLDVHYHARGRS